jgi:hypothetical protein
MYYFQQSLCTGLGCFTGYWGDKSAMPAIGIVDALVLANNPGNRLEKQ